LEIAGAIFIPNSLEGGRINSTNSIVDYIALGAWFWVVDGIPTHHIVANRCTPTQNIYVKHDEFITVPRGRWRHDILLNT
jgi:hypothetical protein